MTSTDPFTVFPELTTRRLLLRAIGEADAPEIFRMRSSGRVNEFIPRPAMQSEDAAHELIRKTNNAWQEKQAIAWAAVVRGEGRIIGTCGFNSIEHTNRRAEIGGEMDVNYWGKRYAVEAVEAIVRFGFSGLRLHTIEAKVSPDNRGAIFILEQLGFRKEAHFRDRGFFNGKFIDMAVYTCFAGT